MQDKFSSDFLHMAVPLTNSKRHVSGRGLQKVLQHGTGSCGNPASLTCAGPLHGKRIVAAYHTNEIMNIAGWKTHAMLLRYLGAPEDRMRSAFSKMDMGYGKARQTQAAD